LGLPKGATSGLTQNIAYSISSSAMLSKPDEIVSPSALAVFMLMASANLAGESSAVLVFFRCASAIANQTTGLDILTKFIHCRNPIVYCQVGNLSAPG